MKVEGRLWRRPPEYPHSVRYVGGGVLGGGYGSRPILRSHVNRRDPGFKRWQSFLRAEVDILAGPGVMAADQARYFGGAIDSLEQQSSAGVGRVLRLGGVEMNGLQVRLRGRGSAVGDVDADTQRAHDVHPNQYRGRFEADDNNKASSPSSFAPLEVEVLGFPSYLERFAVGAVDDPLERLQGTPLGAVLPPHQESHAGH